MAFTPFTKEDQPTMAAFNEKFEQAIQQAIAGGVKIETGSYVGTGIYGTYQYNSLNFSFNPKFLIISSENYYAGTANTGFFFYPATAADSTLRLNSVGDMQGCAVTWGEKHVDWSSTYSATGQLNALGVTYNYIAIG